MRAREEPGQLQSFRLSQLGWRRVHSLPRGPGGGGGGPRTEACRCPQRQAVGSGSIKLHNPGGPAKCRFGSQQQLQLGEPIETPKGCSGVRGKESLKTLCVPPPPPKAQGENRDRTAKQSQRGLLQDNVCKPFSFRREAGPQRPRGPGKRRRP